MRRILAIAVILVICASNAALANWWLVRSSNGKCLVVDIESTDTDKNVTKIGKDIYRSANEAEADAKIKQLCVPVICAQWHGRREAVRLSVPNPCKK